MQFLLLSLDYATALPSPTTTFTNAGRDAA
jgi:hypothetical protein